MPNAFEYLSPEEATAAIATLVKVDERLEESTLSRCIAYAKEALWAAAYPDDPYTMLNQVQEQAEIALG